MALQSIPAVCITLDPYNENRAQRAIDEIRKLGFSSVTFSPGVDGRKLSDDEIRDYTTVRSYYEIHNGRYVHEALSGLGAIGCYLAHLRAWKKCKELNSYLAIFEDDFVLTDGGEEHIVKDVSDALSMDFDILRLAWGINIDFGMITEPTVLDNLQKVVHVQSFAGYILSPKGADRLVSTALPIEMHCDHYANIASYYHNLIHLVTKFNHRIKP